MISLVNCARTSQVRDELEHLLDDDEDMAEMYLTEKLEQQQLDDSSVSSINEQDELDDEANQQDIDERCVFFLFVDKM